MRMIELFAGIGATREAIKEVGINIEAAAISEIEPNAIRGYEAIHGKTANLGDITKIEKLPAADLITYSYPCQSVSIAGKQEGMKEGSGTTSSLVWEVGRLVKDLVSRGEPPSVLLMENVDAVLNKRNIGEFNRWVNQLSDLGYTSSWEVLNAKDYGTPQNRKRLFMVSTFGKGKFIFPPKCPDGRVLRDVLESDVDDSYYLREERLKAFVPHAGQDNTKSNKINLMGSLNLQGYYESLTRIYGDMGISPALNTRGDWSRCPKIISAGRLDSGSRFNSATNVYDVNGIAPTLTTTHPGIGVHKIETIDYEKIRIRYLTPRECLRLQAFPDSAIDALLEVIQSKTQLYKLAGNSIPVCVLRAIFESIYLKRSFTNESDRQVSLNNWGVLI